MRWIVFVALAGIAASTPAPVAAQEESARRLVERGERLFERTCMRCHNEMEPDERTNRQWQMIVPQMRELANITREEARAIIAYLIAMNEEEAGERSERAREQRETRSTSTSRTRDAAARVGDGQARTVDPSAREGVRATAEGRGTRAGANRQ